MPAKQLHVSIDLSIPGQDKAIHVLLFAILTFLAAKAAEELKIVIPGWMLFAVLSLFGLSSEIAQHFIKDRSADFWDLLADIAGVTVVLIYLKLR